MAMRRGEKGDVAVETCSKEEKNDGAAVVIGDLTSIYAIQVCISSKASVSYYSLRGKYSYISAYIFSLYATTSYLP